MPSFTPQYKQKPRSTPAPAPISEATKARIEESKRLQQVIAPQVQPQVQPQDDVGWTEVRRTKRKVKRELTLEEMDARERGREAQEDGEFNTQLFESNRHDHDRV
jgi:tRNA nucleotidyltransferase (CCA-adding enzyme)